MNYIRKLTSVNLEVNGSVEKPFELKKLLDTDFGKQFEVSLRAPEKLAKHKANVPISVLCIAGEGEFTAGEDLEETEILLPGTLITLDRDVSHELRTSSFIRVLVTKFC